MAKTIKHDLTYDAPLAEVASMLLDPEFREQVCDYQQVLSHEVSVEGSHVTIKQVQAARGLPSFATKFVGDEITIVQEEDWHSSEKGDITVTIPGKPGHMKGTAVLVESSGTTTETVELTIKVAIPLVGGKIEGLIGDLLMKALKAENTVGRRYLSR